MKKALSPTKIRKLPRRQRRALLKKSAEAAVADGLYGAEPGPCFAVTAGDRLDLYCFGCSTAFAIIHEPSVAQNCTREEIEAERDEIKHCPYCGGEELESR